MRLPPVGLYILKQEENTSRRARGMVASTMNSKEEILASEYMLKNTKKFENGMCARILNFTLQF